MGEGEGVTDSHDAIVVGLGAIGSASAYHLAKRGARVLGIEQFRPGHDRGSSHGEHRMIRRSSFSDDGYVPLSERALDLWAALGEEAVGLLLVGAALGIRSRPLAAPPAGAAGLPYGRQVAAILAGGAARRLYAVTLAEGALVFGVIAFVPSLLHERFALPLSSAGAVLALFGLGGFAYARSAGWLLRRWAPAQLALVGGALLCAAFATLAWMPHWGWALPAALVGVLRYYLLHGCLQTCATQVSSVARGTAVSLFACALFFGQSVGVSAMAAAMARGLAAPCIGAAGVALLALALYFSRLPVLRAPAGATSQ